jgi:nitroreductase
MDMHEAARWAPAAGNSQPRKFIVLISPEVRKVSADAIPTGRFVSSAPLRIAVRINLKASSHPIHDGAAAT